MFQVFLVDTLFEQKETSHVFNTVLWFAVVNFLEPVGALLPTHPCNLALRKDRIVRKWNRFFGTGNTITFDIVSSCQWIKRFECIFQLDQNILAYFQELVNRGKYAYVVKSEKHASNKSSTYSYMTSIHT